MEKHHNEFVGSIPENYDKHFVPLLFADYARMLADTLDVPDGAHVLETACGTGAVTRNIVRKLDGKARLTATDFNEPMLAQAQKSGGRAPARITGKPTRPIFRLMITASTRYCVSSASCFSPTINKPWPKQRGF